MFAFLDQWQPIEIIMLTTVVAAALVAWNWRRLQVARLEAELKQEALRKGMSLEEIEALLQMSSRPVETCTDEEAVGKVAECLVEAEFPAEQIEQIMADLRAADTPTIHAVCQTTWNMVHADNADCISKETLRAQTHAALRGLLRPSPGTESPPAAQLGE